MNRLLRGALAASAFAFLGLTALTAQAQDEDDTIRKRDNTTVTGKIKSEDIKGCVVSAAKGVEITVRWSDIKSVDYAGPPTFRSARNNVNAGNTGPAIAELEALRAEKDLRTLLKNHVLNLLGSAYMREGNFDKAIERYDELFATFPKSQFVPTAGENLVNCYLSKKNPQGASAALGKMKSAGVDVSQLNVLNARVQEASGDFAGAYAAYKAARDGASDDASKASAELGMARCLFGQKKPSEAEQIYKQITAKDPQPSAIVLAGAWNGLGDIMHAAGLEQKNAELMTAALYDYLRGCVLYVPESGEPTDEYERAVAGAAKCFKAISALEEKDEKKRTLFSQRARERLDHLQAKFPNSRHLPSQSQ